MTELTRPRSFKGKFFVDSYHRELCSEGAGPLRIVPAAVAVPESAEDLARLVRAAAALGIPLVPRSAGSGMPGGNVGSGIVVDLRRLTETIDVSGDTAKASAAVTKGGLDRALAGSGWRLGPDPSSGQFCTIGGMVATNAQGPESLRHGDMHRAVRALDVVTADGELATLTRSQACSPSAAAVERFEQDVRGEIEACRDLILSRFPRTTKNSSGYALDRFVATGDALDIVIGSEGSLVFVTAVELMLVPVLPFSGTAMLVLPDLDTLQEVVALVRKFEPSAVELLDRTILAVPAETLPGPRDGCEAVLLIRLESMHQSDVAQRLDDLRQLVLHSVTEIETGMGTEKEERLWAIRRNASVRLHRLPERIRSLQIIEDGCVPIPALREYIEGVRRMARENAVDIAAFGHAGDGHLHVNALVDSGIPDLRPRLASLLGGVTDLLISLGGTPSGEHGDGKLRTPLLRSVYGDEIVALFASTKRAFDPAGILNPGVVVPPKDLDDPLSMLKIGSDARVISRSSARKLREIEREGRWGQLDY